MAPSWASREAGDEGWREEAEGGGGAATQEEEGSPGRGRGRSQQGKRAGSDTVDTGSDTGIGAPPGAKARKVKDAGGDAPTGAI